MAKTLEGVVIGKRQAEDRYEEAIAAGHTAVMVEKSVNGLYTVNLGNLKPGEEAKIAYRYAQLLRFEGNRVRLAVPTTIAPRYGDPHADGGIKPHEAVQVDLLVEYPFEIAIDIVGDAAAGSLSSPSHSITTAHTASGATRETLARRLPRSRLRARHRRLAGTLSRNGRP